MRCFSSILLTFALGLLTSGAISGESPGVLDKIKTGLEYASSYIETARDIADLVSESLGHRNKKLGDTGGERSENNEKNSFGFQGLVGAFFRLLGLDSSKINAIAVNTAIFLAQMIGTAFNLKTNVKQSRSKDADKEDETYGGDDEDETPGPMRLILGSTNERVQNLVRHARDEKLPEHLIERIDGLDTSCIRLFVCKVSPIIWAAQRSLTHIGNNSRWDVTSWLPSKTDFEENGEKCEATFNDCKLFPDE